MFGEKIYIEEVGKAIGYEHYHLDIFLRESDEKIGSASWDKNQDRYVAAVRGKKKTYIELHKTGF